MSSKESATMAFINNSLKKSLEMSPPTLISDEIQIYINLYLRGMLAFVFGVFGCLVNFVNVSVFITQGVKDSVTLCLLALSMTDMVSMILGTLTVVVQALNQLSYKSSDFDPDAVAYVLSWGAAMFYDMSTATTAFIAVERCLCVAWPFRFKEVMTMRKALMVLLAIYVGHIAVYMPHYLTSGLIDRVDYQTNSTWTGLWLAEERPMVIFIISIIVHLIQPSVCLSIVFVSTQILIIGLRWSTQFRNGMKEGKTVAIADKVTGNTDRKYSLDMEDVLRTSKWRKTSGSLRNVRVIRTVLFLAVICFVCNSVRLGSLVIFRVPPYPTTYGTYKNLAAVLVMISYYSQAVNCSVNAFVYYKYNVSFRNTIQRLFCRNCWIG